MDENKRETDNLEQPEQAADETPSQDTDTSSDDVDEPVSSVTEPDAAEVADKVTPETVTDATADDDDVEASEEDTESAAEASDDSTVEVADADPADNEREEPVADDASSEAEEAGFDDFDIESALAAVATLEGEDETQAEEAYADDDKVGSPSDDIEDYRIVEEPTAPFNQPPFVTLSRGRGASVVPALLLIAIGVWLTVTLTTAPDTLNPLLLAGIVPVVTGVVLIVRWLSTSRWERGTLLLGTICLFAGLAGVFIALEEQFTLPADYPLFGAALGAAFMLTGSLPRKKSGALFAIGAGIVGGSVVALLMLRGAITVDLTTALPTIAPVLAVVVVAVLLLPLLIRQRS